MLNSVLKIIDLLDDAYVTGDSLLEIFKDYPNVLCESNTFKSSTGKTDFIKIIVKGKNGKLSNGNAPSIGIIGRLGGIGARPTKIGLVSDADGAVAAVSIAHKLAKMSSKGDRLLGDVIITTHICPNAPTEKRDPVDFMGSPVSIEEMNNLEVTPEMDAILSIDTTKGNRIINTSGFAISPTVKEGYILKVNDSLLNIMSITSGKNPVTYPLSIQDITPYGNGLFHINSILQPSTATDAPVVGVAITTESPVPGSATGASHEIDVAEVGRFAIEVAKEFTSKDIEFYDKKEFNKLKELYGEMKHFQTKGITY